MASNEFLLFGTAVGANVLSQAAYTAHAQRLPGFSAGEAESAACNKAWRQAALMISAIGKIIADTGVDALDDGDRDALATKIINALNIAITPQLPAGIYCHYAAPTGTPAGKWVLCNGALLNRAGTYAELFTAIGTTYNTGGESGAQFRLPDARGLVLRGLDLGRGLDTGRTMGPAYQADQNKAHTHEFDLMEPDDGAGSFVAADAGGDQCAVFTTESEGGAEARMKNLAARIFISY